LIFARKLGGRIALVPCAVGGTKIDEWSRTSKLYQQMLRRADVARMKGVDKKIDALLWYQGESDCLLKADADTYAEKLRQFVRNVRQDLQQPDLVIIMVAVHAAKSSIIPFGDTVRQAILDVVAKDKRIGVVDAKSDEVTFLQDDLHLSSKGQFYLADQIVRKFLELTSSAQSELSN
jgi:Carbohydrate esterase, sialic acid-specific acetylesterase